MSYRLNECDVLVDAIEVCVRTSKSSCLLLMYWMDQGYTLRSLHGASKTLVMLQLYVC
jgi:hypothetical protein